mmetsp:Transcript_5554/g.12964  ORF Transcript_5554/g.12964 Transcript_5554/m.12964 type:complete len:201 (-) Transcript_5554:390-992(-)
MVQIDLVAGHPPHREGGDVEEIVVVARVKVQVVFVDKPLVRFQRLEVLLQRGEVAKFSVGEYKPGTLYAGGQESRDVLGVGALGVGLQPIAATDVQEAKVEGPGKGLHERLRSQRVGPCGGPWGVLVVEELGRQALRVEVQLDVHACLPIVEEPGPRSRLLKGPAAGHVWVGCVEGISVVSGEVEVDPPVIGDDHAVLAG